MRYIVKPFPYFFHEPNMKHLPFKFRNEWAIITAPVVGLSGKRGLKDIDIVQSTR
jgi:hypothetical protein